MFLILKDDGSTKRLAYRRPIYDVQNVNFQFLFVAIQMKLVEIPLRLGCAITKTTYEDENQCRFIVNVWSTFNTILDEQSMHFYNDKHPVLKS